MTDNITTRKELRRRIADRESESAKALSGLDAAINAAAAALRKATEAERQARQAHVAARKSRSGYLRDRSGADNADRRALMASAAPAVLAALADARKEVEVARHADSRARLFATEALVAELESLALEDGDDMADRIEAILARVPQRVMWRSAFGELLAARPLLSTDDSNLSGPGGEIEEALSELRAIDPTAKNAAKRISEVMRPVTKYLRPQPQVARA